MSTERKNTLRVGFIGLGRMGRPMARHVAGAGFPVLAFDAHAEAMQGIEEAGIKPAASLSQIAVNTDFIIVIVPTDEDVMSICCGGGGLIAGAEPGTIIAVASSVRPETVRAVHDEASGRHIGVLDMPLTKGVRGAEAGDMTLLVGGTEDDLEKARPVMECFSTAIHFLGPVGTAQVAKTVNNLLLWANLVSVFESLEYGGRLGVNPNRLRAALLDCSADSWVLRELDLIEPTWPVKDMENALRMAKESGLDLPLAERVAELVAAVDRPAMDRLLGPDAGDSIRKIGMKP